MLRLPGVPNIIFLLATAAVFACSSTTKHNDGASPTDISTTGQGGSWVSGGASGTGGSGSGGLVGGSGGIGTGGSVAGGGAGGRSGTGGFTSTDFGTGGQTGTGGSGRLDGGAGTAGQTGTGGKTGGGGQSGVGGQPGTGGQSGTGGRLGTGGQLGTGGAVVSGGRTGSGGIGAGGATGGGGIGTGTTPQIPATPLPTVETDSFTPSSSTTDIADDSAIYANPSSPELSVVIADNKDTSAGGVGVFNMQGKLLQFRQDGTIGNVDLRADFPFGGQSIVLVGANNRNNDTLIFWQLDPAKQQLSAPIGNATAIVSSSYGFCLYHSAQSGKFYAFVTQMSGTSTMEQYELGESGGKVTATKVRSFDVGSITEGCVVDDELGRLYVAQEDVALWRYGAEPSAGSTRVQVAAVGDGHVEADLEGVGLAKGPGTTGYIVVSIQGESRFAVYDRESNAYLRGFVVAAGGSIDAVSETDGLDISTANLGPGFPKGALVVHDGSNTGGTTSNLKFIPLQ